MRRFFRDFMIYGFTSVLGKMIAIFTMPVFTSILTREEYGAMALITSCQGIIDLVSNLNIHSGIAREYYETDDEGRKKLVSTGFYSIISIALTICIILVASQRLWRESLIGVADDYELAFILMLVTIPCSSLLSYFAILTRYKKKPILYTIGTTVQLLIQISISIIGVVKMGWGINSMFLGILTGQIFAFVFFFIINRSLVSFTFSFPIIKRALKFSIPTLPAILAGWLDGSLGQILIGKYVSLADLGVYSIALHLASVLSLISIGLQNVWGPFLYENYKKDSFKCDVARLFTIIAFTLLVGSCMVSLFSREIILIFTNVNYLDARKYVTILMIPMSIYMLYPIAASGVHISRDTKYIGIAYVAGSIMNLSVLLFSIGRLGVIAVPLCLMLSRITTFLTLYKVSERKIAYNLPISLLGWQIMVIALCYVINTADLNLLIRICIAIVVLMIVAVLLVKKYNAMVLIKSILSKRA